MGNVHEVGAPDPQLGRIFGVAEPLACRSTAIVSLTASRGGARISSHTLTNPYLALHVLGGYRDRSDVGELNIAGPAAIFYPGGSAHEMVIAPSGLSTVIVEFDPDWLQRLLGAEANFGAPRQWVGGEAGRRAGESGENLKLRLGLRDTHRPTRRLYV